MTAQIVKLELAFARSRRRSRSTVLDTNNEAHGVTHRVVGVILRFVLEDLMSGIGCNAAVKCSQ